MANTVKPVVGIIMGSKSDWGHMEAATVVLEELGIAYGTGVISAHRTPDRAIEYAKNAQKNGLKIIIAGAGGAAHLAGIMAGLTRIPVIGVPIESASLRGMDSLLSIVQMPPGTPVATMAINGAKNAGLFAAAILALENDMIDAALQNWREQQTAFIEEHPFELTR